MYYFDAQTTQSALGIPFNGVDSPPPAQNDEIPSIVIFYGGWSLVEIASAAPVADLLDLQQHRFRRGSASGYYGIRFITPAAAEGGWKEQLFHEGRDGWQCTPTEIAATAVLLLLLDRKSWFLDVDHVVCADEIGAGAHRSVLYPQRDLLRTCTKLCVGSTLHAHWNGKTFHRLCRVEMKKIG